MSKLPYFKFYPQDFLVGTSFMTPSEVGGYIRLLCTAWENGGIPRDSQVISRITGCDSAESLNILEKFEIVDDKYYNKRLESERNNLIDRSKVNSDNAKQRWERNANAMQSHSERICETVCENDAYQKSEVKRHSQKSEVKNNACDDKPSRYIPVNFESLWIKYPQHRRREKEKCRIIYNRDCKDLTIEGLFVDALNKYSQSKDYCAGFIQLSITWFRDWKTWLDYNINEELKAKG